MNMNENSKPISGFEGLYEITESGRVISLRSKRPLARCNDEYGFHIVKLTNGKGEAKNFNLFELWQATYPQKSKLEFKGACNVKYGKSCTKL